MSTARIAPLSSLLSTLLVGACNLTPAGLGEERARLDQAGQGFASPYAERALPVLPAALTRAGKPLAKLHQGPAVISVAEFIRRVPADVMVEITTLDPRTGEPATAHIAAALRRGLHVVTANKGPVAFARRRRGRPG